MALKTEDSSNKRQAHNLLQQEARGRVVLMPGKHMSSVRVRTLLKADSSQLVEDIPDHPHPHPHQRAVMASQANNNSLPMACPNNRNMAIQTHRLQQASRPMVSRSMVRRKEGTSRRSLLIPLTAQRACSSKAYRA